MPADEVEIAMVVDRGVTPPIGHQSGRSVLPNFQAAGPAPDHLAPVIDVRNLWLDLPNREWGDDPLGVQHDV